MLTPHELAHSSAQLYRDVLLTIIRYGDHFTPAEAVRAAEELVSGYVSRFGPDPALVAQLDETEEQLRDAEDARDYNRDTARLYGRLAAFWKARGATGDEWKGQPAEPAPWPELAEVLIAHGCEDLGSEHMLRYVEVTLEEHEEQARLIETLKEQLADMLRKSEAAKSEAGR